jgi:hypothetical protein
VAYVEEFLAICMVLRERLGKSTVVLPLPPIILGGLEHPATVRSVYELMSWSDDYFKNEMAYLDASMKLAREIIEEQGRDRRVVEFRRMLLLDMQAKCGRKAWNSGGEGSSELPCELMPMSGEQERRWLTGLIDEIRTKLALDLDPVPNLERGMGLQSKPKRKVDFMIIGSSNAARLTKSMNNAGYSVCKILNRNWRISRDSCEAMARTVIKTAEEEDPEVVVLFLMDGSIFYSKGPDGSRTLPRRGEDGKFHIEGDLVVCSADTQTEHLNTMRPVLDTVGRRPCIVISPMMRYVIEGCCQNPGHVSNRNERFYREDMQRQLDGVARNIQEFPLQNPPPQHEGAGEHIQHQAPAQRRYLVLRPGASD